MSDIGTTIKRTDQLSFLAACLKFTETEVWDSLFAYPNCGHDLFNAGLIAFDSKITPAGRAALFLVDYKDE